MPKSKFSDEAIAFALRPAETGTRVDEICQKMGISDTILYNRKKRYGALGIAQVRRMKQIEDQERPLRQLVVDRSLDKKMLRDVIGNKLRNRE